MPIQNASDSQKVDYLWKKIAYGATKTDIAGNIDATQEPFPSPLQIRADRILQNSDQIPAVIPGSNTSVVSVYTTSLPVECTSDSGIATPTLTWLTGQTFWIPPEFGSTYQVKVYISPSGQAGNVLTKGTQVFATGSGNNDLWVFDYQSGILNFNSNNTPYNASNQPISFTGNSVYISGAVYSGAFGLPTATSVGNLTFSNTTISTSWASANIILSATGTGTVQIGGDLAFGLPTGNTVARPTSAEAGYIRFNTDTNLFEYYNGTDWDTPGAATISSQTINPDGTSNAYSLGYTTTSAGIIVSINGTLQQPGNAYTVTGNTITFSETPLFNDVIEIRKISAGVTSVTSLQYGAETSVTLDSANITVKGNLIPSANVTYSLGSADRQWKDLYVSSNTIYLGGTAVSISNGQLAVSGNIVAPPPYGNANVIAYTESMGFKNYSNVNVTAYTETMGFKNYSNVNVAAYTQSQSYTNYSNVNLSAYLGGAVTIGGNLTVSGNLFVNGNITTVNANNLTINDSLIYLADDNPADVLDIGIVSSFTDAVRYQHTGFARDATDGTWKLFANVVSEPTTTIDFTNASYSNILVGNITSASLNSTGNILSTGAVHNSLTVNGNVSSGNLSVTGNISATGSIIQNGVTGGIIPIGGIIMWSGNIAAIPTNWALCNGSNGTPDLRDKFIVGASADSGGQANTTITTATTKSGGSANLIVPSHSHTATVTDPGHFHATRGTRQVQAGADNSGPYVTESNWANDSNQYRTSANVTGITVGISTDGSSATNANLPPYYALAFIMRVS